MYGMLLSVHISAAVLSVVGTLATLIQAGVRKGSLTLSKWGLLSSCLATIVSGLMLVQVTGSGMGRVCVLGSAFVLCSWGAYALLRKRLPVAIPAV